MAVVLLGLAVAGASIVRGAETFTTVWPFTSDAEGWSGGLWVDVAGDGALQCNSGAGACVGPAVALTTETTVTGYWLLLDGDVIVSVETSTDGSAWVEVHTETVTGVGPLLPQFTVNIGPDVTHIRLLATSSDATEKRLSEAQVMGDDTPPEPEPTPTPTPAPAAPACDPTCVVELVEGDRDLLRLQTFATVVVGSLMLFSLGIIALAQVRR